MNEVNAIRKRIQKNENPTKERTLIKIFNVILVLLLITLGGLIYCKQDENGKLLKELFNVDVSFVEMNNKIEETINNLFNLHEEESEDHPVASLDLYHSLGNNNYTTDDHTIRAIRDGKVFAITNQDEYKNVLAINYDNGVQALYTLLDEINVELGSEISSNSVIGSYQGDYFNCVFKYDGQVITYNEALK